MKKFLLSTLLFCFSLTVNGQSWELVYENDENGNVLNGSIEVLKKAVRDGLPIRVGWGTPGRIEHTADAKFMTIMKNKVVFAQIDPIYGQTPNMTDEHIELKEGLQWVMIAASNGKFDAMMSEIGTGKVVGHNKGGRAFKWYVRKRD